MSKKVILTGIRANNDLTLGNYFGAILPMTDMAKNHSEEYQINLFIPDLHSITTPIDYSQLQKQIVNNLRIFVASGLPLNKPEIHIYRQSHVPAHSEMTWILDCFTDIGQVSRMTQFKEKSGGLKLKVATYGGGSTYEDGSVYGSGGSNLQSVSVGLFNYPVLMAADILLYGSSYVPVGDDQTQHLEFTRDIAERMNKKFNQELFVVPEPVKKQHEFFGKDQGLRIMDLADPTKKNEQK